MANTNFKPWLGDLAITEPAKQLQNTYSNLTTVGFQPNGFVKAGDFNAALRMATLVCAGLANALGFDSTQTIDSSEAAIAAAIKSPSFTSINTTGAITAGGVLTGASLKIGNDAQISSDGRVTAWDVDVVEDIHADYVYAKSDISCGTIYSENNVTARGTVYGDSLNIGGNAVEISSDGDFSGGNINAKAVKVTSIDANSVHAEGDVTGGQIYSENNVTARGTVYGDSLNIGGNAAQISSDGDFTGRNIDAKAVKGTNITASGVINGDSLDINGLERIDPYGHITGASVTSYGKLSGTYLNIGPLNDTVATRIGINGDISTTGNINTTGAFQINNSDRITKSGIMIPQSLNLKKIENCASTTNSATVILSSTKTSDSKEFGCKLPADVSENKRAYIFLVFINIQVKETNTAVEFNCDHFGLLTAPTDPSQGSIVFNIYSGDGASVGNNWGQVRISYQPYSMTTAKNGCYVSYKAASSTFNGTVRITVKMYPIATFN